MALSKQVFPGDVQDIQVPVIGQHYLVCGTEYCKKNCQFYCNSCHQPLCEQCKDEHRNIPENKNHEVVPYRQRIRKLPVEKCKDHPTKDIDMICENCQVAVCSKCLIKDHRGHTFDDLETIYSKNFTLCLDKIYNINQYYLPTSQDIKRDIKEDVLKLKAFMDKIRTSIKAEADSVKRLVEKAMSDNLEQANEMEETLLEKVQSQDKDYDEYNGYLENLVKEFQGYLSYDNVQNNPIIFSLSEVLNIEPIPKSTEPVYPVFTAGQYSKNDIAKLLGTVTVPTTKPASRKIKPMDITSTQLKPTRKLKEADGDELEVKQKCSLYSPVTNVKEYIVPGVGSVYHISRGKSGILWASDASGNLVQTDLQGKQLQMIKTSNGTEGYHTITLDGNLIFANRTNCRVNRITHGKTTTRFFTTEWVPFSIHTSNLNGDIMVGLSTFLKGKVARYNKTGKEIQSIERDNKGQELYSEYPHYITENINGDICVSDCIKQAVIVVKKSGQHRFSYTGQESKIRPYGICTDILGHIIVCDNNSQTVHLLDQDGQFLTLLVTSQKRKENPVCVCVDDDNNLHVGHGDTSTVIVYKYLQ